MIWKQTTTVRPDGTIELVVPPFHPGDLVEVSVQPGQETTAPRPRRQPGSAKGRITIRDHFDAPLPDFKDYT
jgi:hypothetical protein